MAIDSVSSSSGAQASVARAAADAQPAERRESRPEERKEKPAEAPRPVSNAEGQTTGTVIDTTA